MTESGNPPPTARVRPATVTVAFWLQASAVAAGLVVVALAVVAAVQYDRLISRAAELTNADPVDVSDERVGNLIGTVMIAGPGLVLTIWLAATVIPVWRGSNVGRIFACVGIGLQALCCLGSGASSLLALPVLFLATATDDPEFTEAEGDTWMADGPFYDKLYELESESVSFMLTAVVPLTWTAVFAVSIAAGVLLLLPSSHRFYSPGSAPPPRPPYPYGYPVYYWPPPPPPPSAPRDES